MKPLKLPSFERRPFERRPFERRPLEHWSFEHWSFELSLKREVRQQLRGLCLAFCFSMLVVSFAEARRSESGDNVQGNVQGNRFGNSRSNPKADGSGNPSAKERSPARAEDRAAKGTDAPAPFAARIEPRADQELMALTRSLAAQGKIDEAVQRLERLIASLAPGAQALGSNGGVVDPASKALSERRALARLALALILFEAGRDPASEEQLRLSLADGLRVQDIAFYHIGLIMKRAGRLSEARDQFERVIGGDATPETETEAKLQLGEILIAQKQWREAVTVYENLRRRMSGREKYPEVLYNLLRAELLGAQRGSKRRGKGCRWANEIYSKYPSHPLVKHWGPNLEDNTVEGERIGCVAETSALKMRTRRLQLSGEAERAATELRQLNGSTSEGGSYSLDAMLANHLINDGQVDEALQLLLRHYKSQRSRPPYMNLLAKAASRAGENQAAIGAYDRAYELAPRSRGADQALFFAAFTCYQIQDYDGATRRFQKLIREFPKARWALDAQWYLAWIRYLRDDHQGAYESFNALAKLAQFTKAGKRTRYVKVTQSGRGGRAKTRRVRILVRSSVAADSLSVERLRYWTAMSLLKLGRTSEALAIFQSLVRDPAIGYYSILAYYRIQQTPGAQLPPEVANRLGLKKSSVGSLTSSSSSLVLPEGDLEAASEEFDPEGRSASAGDAGIDTVTAENGARTADKIAENAGENIGLDGATASADGVDNPSGESGDEVSLDPESGSESGSEPGAEGEVAGNPDLGPSSESQDSEEAAERTQFKLKEFKSPALSFRFERARDFLLLGLDHQARRELSEIERKARTVADRRRLMVEYANAGNYWRSSTIGEISFGSARLRGGLVGESRQYWEFAYPRAWEKSVTEAAQTTAVPEEFIWGLMRAESHYRYDARSPVGALGLMQIMPYTGKQLANLIAIDTFETPSLLLPETNIRLGTRYLQRLLERFSGSIPLAAASYNAGPHRTHAWVRNFGTLDMDEFIEHIPFAETRNYVKKVARNYQIYSLLYSQGVHSLNWLVRPVGVQVDEKIPTREIW